MPVAIGDSACVDDLREIASMPDRVISCGVNEDPSKLGRKLLRGRYSIVCFPLRIKMLYNKCCLGGPVVLWCFCMCATFQPKIRVTTQFFQQ